MTIARVSCAGRSKDLQSMETGTESERRGDDESDADHKELMSAYGCDDYLLRWLPNIGNDEKVSVATTRPRQCEEKKERKEQSEQLCVTVSSDNILKTPSRNPHQTKDADVSSGNRVFQETGRLAYFEAIKCSPMKIRQSLAIMPHKRPKVSERGLAIRQHSRSPEKQGMGIPKNRVNPSVVDITSNPVRQLGSLCFQTNNAARCRSEVRHSSFAGSKTSKTRRDGNKTSTRNNSALRVRCESVIIYPKTLVPHANEKLAKPTMKTRKVAWRENSLASHKISEEGSTKLPELTGVTESGLTSQERKDGKVSPECEGNSTEKQEQKETPSVVHCTASTKIIIPFGDVLQYNTEFGCGKSGKHVALRPEEVNGSERKSNGASRVHDDQNSKKKRECFYGNHKACRSNSFAEKSKRRVTSMVITQLGTPRTPLNVNQPSSTTIPNAPTIRTETVGGLFPGREELPWQNAGARFSYNQRKRADFGMKNKERPLTEKSEHDGGKCLLSTGSDVSLKIGGTALLREQRGMQEIIGKGEDTDEHRGLLIEQFIPSLALYDVKDDQSSTLQ